MTGLKPSVLRYWETEFRELRPEKDAADQRRYRPTDIEVVLAIRKLLYEDRFTIKGARGRLREELRRLRHDAVETSMVVPIAPAPPEKTPRAGEEAPRVAAESQATRAANGDAGTKASMPQVIEFFPRSEVRPLLDKLRKQQIELSLSRLRAEINALLLVLS